MSNCNKCNSCEKECCDNPMPFFGIDLAPNSNSVLMYNVNGVTSTWDYRPIVEQNQTDTAISIKTIERVLKYAAERHIDTISAKELGSILRLSDISDIDIADVKNNSMLMFKKDGECAYGDLSNSWVAFNADEDQSTSVTSFLGYDNNYRPQALSTPLHTNQYYQLGWNGNNKISYSQPVEVSTAPRDTDGKKLAVYVDPTTKQLIIVREN